MRRQVGFTLLELLIVLAILAILIGLVALTVGRLRQTAMERSMGMEKEIVQRAIDSYNTVDIAGGAPAIPARAVAMPIIPGDADAPFTKYLDKRTRYAYSWGEKGDNLNVSPSGSAEVEATPSATPEQPTPEPESAEEATLKVSVAVVRQVLLDVLAMPSTTPEFAYHSPKPPTSSTCSNWSCRLERLLEQGRYTFSVANPWQQAMEGNNQYNLINPVSGKQSIFHWPNPLSSLPQSYRAYMPPAVFITDNPGYAPTSEGHTEGPLIRGTVIVYVVKNNNTAPIHIYYVRSDGSKSDPMVISR